MLCGLMTLTSYIGRTKPPTGMETGTSPPKCTIISTTQASTGVSKFMSTFFKDGEATVLSMLLSQSTNHNINQFLKYSPISTDNPESLFKDTQPMLGSLCIMLKFWTQRSGIPFSEMMIWTTLLLTFIGIKLSLLDQDLPRLKMLAMNTRPSFLNKLIDLSTQCGLVSGLSPPMYALGG